MTYIISSFTFIDVCVWFTLNIAVLCVDADKYLPGSASDTEFDYVLGAVFMHVFLWMFVHMLSLNPSTIKIFNKLILVDKIDIMPF